MKHHSEATACVVDFGMVGVPLAERLSRKPDGFKKVLLFQEWEEDYSTLNKAILGDGFQEFERVRDVWSVKDKVDVFVFPDVQRSKLQLELVRQGKPVWGGRDGDSLELDREMFLDTLKQVGLLVPPHEVVVGVNALRSYLKDKKDQYIKISLYRGSFETCHFRSWKLDEGMVDQLASGFGPAKELVRFLVFPNIDTPLEIGCDTLSVDGQWPQSMLHGVEWKDKSYFGAVTKRADMPQQLLAVLHKFGPVLGKYHYRNFFSCEVRVKGSKSYFTDATCRMGLPSFGSQLELWKNLPEIVWHGAQGKLVEPVAIGRFCAEAMVSTNHACDEWGLYDVPKELRQWTKFMKCFEYEGMVCFPPIAGSTLGNDVGWLVATGNTPEETILTLNKRADQLPDGMSANTESLAYVLKEIAFEQKSGIKFSDAAIPKPGFVMES